MSTFAELGLTDSVLRGITDLGFINPTPIQSQAIPAVLQGRDVIGASQTGTGKTAAFALPLLSRLKEHSSTRCLILEPTRELAAQVYHHLLELGKHTGLTMGLLHGGVGFGNQNEDLKKQVDILIATPGRLLDHMQRGTAKLNKIEYLVLDEVDRMLDMGFLPQVRKIVERCPKSRQTLFFSATMPPQIESLAHWALKEPVEIEIGQSRSAADTISHYFYPVATAQRQDLLFAILKATDYHSVMIFTKTKAQADHLYHSLKQAGQEKMAVMHSDLPQNKRAAALKGFREGAFEVIIATDLAARGLDISKVTHVINYSVPENPEDYVHRIGRTGRASAEGVAYTILTAEELPYAESIERYIKQKIERKKLESFDYLYSTLLDDDAEASRKRLQSMLGKNRTSSRRRR